MVSEFQDNKTKEIIGIDGFSNIYYNINEKLTIGILVTS